jgi:hypothetical protein
MDDEIVKEANRLKRVAGQKLEDLLLRKFQELKDNNIIKGYQGKTNYSHTGYSYTHQYKTNFVLETLDDKRIIINSSNSFRDRVKQDLYDFEGIMKHADIADKIIASILLYPDEEFAANKTLQTFRYNAENKIAYCPATHILSFLELIEFLENHKAEVEREEVREEHSLRAYQSARSGSNFGKKGNKFEKDVVDLLNSLEQLELYQQGSSFVDPIYSSIIKKLMFDYDLDGELPTVVQATNTIKKLSNGSNAKTDVIVRVETNAYYLSETVSIKNTSQKSVSCHDYRAEDFIRVLEISDTKLAEYFHFYQHFGSHKSFDEGLPYDYSVEEFEQLLKPYAERLVEWALTGKHDVQRLIEPETQTSNYILINKPEEHRFTDFDSYIKDIKRESKKVYGVPLGWTYPSKKRGERIQLKMPVII